MTNEPSEPAPLPAGVGKVDYELTGGIGGHPRGLNVLFFTEMWERFSYYGMRAILMLFMEEAAAKGGLGIPHDVASNIYGTYTMCVYLTSIPGGLIADRIIGPRKAILLGGIIIALGHFTMAFPSITTFYAGLTLIVLGTGLLKPNISTMVGRLYSPTDVRRDAGFSIYYMSINIGAFLSPLVCGTLAQGKEFQGFLAHVGLPPESSWHFGFAAAGVGMCLGLASLVYQYKLLDKVGGTNTISRSAPKAESAPKEETGPKQESSTIDEISTKDAKSANAGAAPAAEQTSPESSTLLTIDEWRKLGAIALLLVFAALFWAIYEQGGSSLNVFAEKLTDCTAFGYAYPASWFQALQPIYVIALAPVFSWLWIKMGEKQPSSPAKFALGLLLLGLATLIMVPASMLSATGKVSAGFLIMVYLVQTLGELCLSPVGLSTVTKLAPRRFQAMTMGAWFVSNALGNKLAGYLSSLCAFDASSSMAAVYGGMGGATIFAAFVLFMLTPKIRQLMGSVK